MRSEWLARMACEHRWHRVGICAVALAGLLAGCGVTNRPVPHGSGASSTVTRGGFVVTLHLSTTRIGRGAPINGSLVVVNNTGKKVSLPCLRNGTLAVGIGNSHIPFRPAFTSVNCASWLYTGTTVFPRTVITTYQGCGYQGVPTCSEPPVPAALSPGAYWTATAAMGVLPSPAPNRVQLLPAEQPI